MSSSEPTTPIKSTPATPLPSTTKQMFDPRDYPTPVGVQFNKKQRDYQLFPEEYFTSTDCQVYFNDVYMDDITGLSFQLNELTDQIFGYASNTWDYHARGRRIVQGQFRIAFKEAGYMWTVLDHLGQMGGDSTTHLAWLMNDETRNIYNGFNGAPKRTYGQVLENIEDIFYRNHADQSAKKPDTSATRKETITFDWDVKSTTMQLGESDSTARHKNRKERYGTTGAVTQLQKWLQNKGYGFASKKFNWSKHYGNDVWYTDKGLGANSAWSGNEAHDKKASKKNGNGKPVLSSTLFNNPWIKKATGTKPTATSGDWYMIARYVPESGHSGYTKHKAVANASSGHSWNERELQEAFHRYPGELDGIYTGASDGGLEYDGRYGSGPTGAIRVLMNIAGYDDGSKGYWVSQKTKDYLEMGFAVNGKYDFPTKLAVWIFQDDMAKKGKLKSTQVTGKVDYDTMMLMTEEVDVAYTVEGASLYKPEELYESRMAMYEKEVWGRAFVDNAETVRKQESFFYRGRLSETDSSIRYTDKLVQKGFDIYINYGPLSQYVRSKLFAIAHDVSFNTTVKAIRNVQIYDVQQVLDPNTGQCIEEIYMFYAKDLD